MTSIVVYASDRDSISLHHNNTTTDFIVELDKTIRLNKKSTVELLEFICRFNDRHKDVLYILSDICQNSYLCGSTYPVLRVVVIPGVKNQFVEFNNSIKIPTMSGVYSKFRIYINSKILDHSHFLHWRCSLHFNSTMSVVITISGNSIIWTWCMVKFHRIKKFTWLMNKLEEVCNL